MTPTREPAAIRDDLLDLLRGQYLGPAGGLEETLQGSPHRTYLVGILYPQGPSADEQDPGVLGADAQDDELDQPIELANAWYPASAAVSFLLEAAELHCTVTAGTYGRDAPDGQAAADPGGPTQSVDTRRPAAPPVLTARSVTTDGENRSCATDDAADASAGSERRPWRRRPWATTGIHLCPGGTDADRQIALFEGRARLVSVWRPTGTGWLVTVALENLARHDDADAAPPNELCLFQVQLTCRTTDGRIRPYPTSSDLSQDHEDQELRLLYRDRRVYGVGHGCSVDWDTDPDGAVRTVRTQMLPSTVVPAVRATASDAPILRLAHLADESVPTPTLVGELESFVADYRRWTIEQRHVEAAGLPEQHQAPAGRLLDRMDQAVTRMGQGIALLQRDPGALLAFRLATYAMREQMLQSRHVAGAPGSRGTALPERVAAANEPTWRPFQLGFQLLSLASTADPSHQDRETVDLIWFPTGGGKTEAYLGLAAFEMIRRRLTRGVRGGGTAVLTRYTLRLLTTQQFQRAATLICALERLRDTRAELRDAPPFSIGLWVGSETTPNTFAAAHALAVTLRRAQTPENPFQIQTCPWCGTRLIPGHKQPPEAYGMRTTKNTFELFCPHPACPFHRQLPVAVVDDQIYADPPTLLIATVDKFARLPWLTDAGALFGRAAVPYDPPGLVIQDELHLLSGPLGTTVALYEAAVQSLLAWDGTPPKIVASTATIRAADHQVRNLFASTVTLFPPSGLNADDSYFAESDDTTPGRLYLGLMPQAHSPAFATVLTCTALLQGPAVLGLQGRALDAYWTLVAYHNSLQELGRTVTIARDDVESLLRARSTDSRGHRNLKRDSVVELTSNVSAAELPRVLTRLERPVGHRDAVDLVATTNMLSVGIDISRLGLMLMNGQPKTTSEYIQATSRVGRATVPGLVVTLLRASRPRDRSHYESFRAYHEALYRHVEPTSVTPWSLASRDRTLSAVLVLLVRHGVGLRTNDAAGDFSTDDPRVRQALRRLEQIAQRADPDEAQPSAAALATLAREWEQRASRATEAGERLCYVSKDGPALLKDFGQPGPGWPTAHSMRSVDRQVRVLAVGETR